LSYAERRKGQLEFKELLVNNWMHKFNLEARPAYLKEDEVVIPRLLLKKNTPSRNTWLKKK
jgi:hypothetical protein